MNTTRSIDTALLVTSKRLFLKLRMTANNHIGLAQNYPIIETIKTLQRIAEGFLFTANLPSTIK